MIRPAKEQARKLSPADVQAIRQDYRPYDRTFGRKALARRFGVSIPTIRDVVNRYTWRAAA